MTQLPDKESGFIPVTVIEAGPVIVTQIKIKDKDGYNAVQVGFDESKHIKKPRLGLLKKVFSKENEAEESSDQNQEKEVKKLKYFKEFETTDLSQFKVGDILDVSQFKIGDLVKVEGVSKSKGFQGVVKRHHFGGASKTHGTKHAHREPGSIGAQGPQRVIKGTRMAGRTGGDKITIKNLEVIDVDPEHNLLFVRGAVPGKPGDLLKITK